MKNADKNQEIIRIQISKFIKPEKQKEQLKHKSTRMNQNKEKPSWK